MSSKYLSMFMLSNIKTTTKNVIRNGPMKASRTSLSIFFMSEVLEFYGARCWSYDRRKV
jgi:hypothetical protein